MYAHSGEHFASKDGKTTFSAILLNHKGITKWRTPDPRSYSRAPYFSKGNQIS